MNSVIMRLIGIKQKKSMLLSNIMNQHCLFFSMFTQVSKGMKGILGLFGKHKEK